MNTKLLVIICSIVLLLTGCCSSRVTDECGGNAQVNYYSCNSHSCQTNYRPSCRTCDSTTYVVYQNSDCSSCENYYYSNDSCDTAGGCPAYHDEVQYENCFDNIGCNNFQQFSCAQCNY